MFHNFLHEIREFSSVTVHQNGQNDKINKNTNVQFLCGGNVLLQ
jgi:hypothetical protein